MSEMMSTSASASAPSQSSFFTHTKPLLPAPTMFATSAAMASHLASAAVEPTHHLRSVERSPTAAEAVPTEAARTAQSPRARTEDLETIS